MKIILAIVLTCGLPMTARSAEEIEEYLDITYISYGDRELKLNIYRPVERAGDLPGIVGMHGGAWVKGSRINYSKQAKALAAEGYVAVSISYRLADEAKFPAQIQDCQAAVRWLKANAEEYGVDANRIGVTGHSAGGHLAALLATSSNSAASWTQSGDLRFSAEVQACVADGAQSDMETERIARVSETEKAYFYRVFLGDSQRKAPEAYRLASPLAHLDAYDPPMMFISGEHDDLSTRADRMRAALDEKGIANRLFVIEGAPHHIYKEEGSFATWLDQAVSFFDEHLKDK